MFQCLLPAPRLPWHHPPACLPTLCLLACLLQVSAALAAASMLLKAGSPALAASWLSHAQQLHGWALEKQGEGRRVETLTARGWLAVLRPMFAYLGYALAALLSDLPDCPPALSLRCRQASTATACPTTRQ